MSGIAVMQTDGLFRPAMHVYVGRSYADHIVAFVYDVAPAKQTALLLQIGDMHGHGTAGYAEHFSELALLDGRFFSDYLKYFPFSGRHIFTSYTNVYFINICLL